MARKTDRGVRITLHHSPILKLANLEKDGTVTVAPGATVHTLLEKLGIPNTQHRYLMVYANGERQKLSYTLREGDAVQLFLPIGGG